MTISGIRFGQITRIDVGKKGDSPEVKAIATYRIQSGKNVDVHYWGYRTPEGTLEINSMGNTPLTIQGVVTSSQTTWREKLKNMLSHLIFLDVKTSESKFPSAELIRQVTKDMAAIRKAWNTAQATK